MPPLTAIPWRLFKPPLPSTRARAAGLAVAAHNIRATFTEHPRASGGGPKLRFPVHLSEYHLFISYARKDNAPVPETCPRGWVAAIHEPILADHRPFSTAR